MTSNGLLALLARVTSRLGILDGYAAADREALLADRVRLGDLTYTFQTAVEATIDAAHHVVADRGLGVPATATWRPRWRASSGCATCSSTATPRSTTGLVVDHLANLKVLRRFVAAMTALL